MLCGSSRRWFSVILFLGNWCAFVPQTIMAQCAGEASTPRAAADCASRSVPAGTVAAVDPARAYTLAELIDLAEHNNPRTRVAWERAKQRADALGIAKSAYYPILAGIAAGSTERIINPFPKPLSPEGFVMVDIHAIQVELTLQYLIFDFGKRAAEVDAATAGQLVAGANFVQVNQDVAFRVSGAYYRLLTAQERLQATQDILKTARTTLDSAEARLSNGRGTRPDVLNARAEVAQAVFDQEAASGEEQLARVALSETIGAEPSPNIQIDAQKSAQLPESLTLPVDQLIERAMAGRPDLAALAAEIRAADDEVLAAKSDFKPRFFATADVAQTSLWPMASEGTLGSASRPTWAATVGLQWRLFDGGARSNHVAATESKRRELQDEVTEKRDQATREVWSSYINFHTALRKHQAATAAFEAANESYSASLDAYNFGVRNLVDVVTAEKQLALARLSTVSARSQLFLEAVGLEFVTGNLLRNQPPATQPSQINGSKP